MSAAVPFIGPTLSVAAATSANEIGKFNQDVANRNAIIAEQEAEAQAKLTEFNIAKFNQSFEKFQSTTKVAILKSGVELSGTALKILQSNAEQAELQKDIIEYNGKVAEAKKAVKEVKSRAKVVKAEVADVIEEVKDISKAVKGRKRRGRKPKAKK